MPKSVITDQRDYETSKKFLARKIKPVRVPKYA
jgi:hypothetical protein